MSVQPIGGNLGAPRKSQGDEITTVTVNCKKEHKHTPECPHTTSTQPAPQAAEKGAQAAQPTVQAARSESQNSRPAPQMGEPGHLLDEKA